MCLVFRSARLWRIKVCDFLSPPTELVFQNVLPFECKCSKASSHLKFRYAKVFHASAAQVLFWDNWIASRMPWMNHSKIYFGRKQLRRLGSDEFDDESLQSAPLAIEKAKNSRERLWVMTEIEWMSKSLQHCHWQRSHKVQLIFAKILRTLFHRSLVQTCSCPNVIEREIYRDLLSLNFSSEDAETILRLKWHRALLCSIDMQTVLLSNIWFERARYQFGFIHSAPVAREKCKFGLVLPISLSAAFRTSFVMTASNDFHFPKFNELFTK